MSQTFQPSLFFLPQQQQPAATVNGDKRGCRLLILNQPIHSMKLFKLLFSRANTVVCADGGANRLYDLFAKDEEERKLFLPALILGDLDSLRGEVSSYYRALGVTVLKDHDQDSTDFQKCLNHPLFKAKEHSDVFVFGALSGRFDHCMSSLHTLLLNPTTRIFLLSADSIAWLLVPGQHEIIADERFEGTTCGLIPLTGQALCKTKGLRWNLDHSLPLLFGKLVSTSNQFDEGSKDSSGLFRVHVEIDIPIIWTAEFQS